MIATVISQDISGGDMIRNVVRAVARTAAAIVMLAGIVVVIAAIMAPAPRISSSIDIAAPPSQVWQVLTDLPAWSSWNPTITALVGKLAPGSIIENVEGSGEEQMVFWPRVLIVAPNHELEWRGRLWGLPLLFIAKHDFRLEPIPTGTRFVQCETFGGALLWLFDVHALLPGFVAMNTHLAQRVLASPLRH